MPRSRPQANSNHAWVEELSQCGLPPRASKLIAQLFGSMDSGIRQVPEPSSLSSFPFAEIRQLGDANKLPSDDALVLLWLANWYAPDNFNPNLSRQVLDFLKALNWSIVLPELLESEFQNPRQYRSQFALIKLTLRALQENILEHPADVINGFKGQPPVEFWRLLLVAVADPMGTDVQSHNAWRGLDRLEDRQAAELLLQWSQLLAGQPVGPISWKAAAKLFPALLASVSSRGQGFWRLVAGNAIEYPVEPIQKVPNHVEDWRTAIFANRQLLTVHARVLNTQHPGEVDEAWLSEIIRACDTELKKIEYEFEQGIAAVLGSEDAFDLFQRWLRLAVGSIGREQKNAEWKPVQIIAARITELGVCGALRGGSLEPLESLLFEIEDITERTHRILSRIGEIAAEIFRNSELVQIANLKDAICTWLIRLVNEELSYTLAPWLCGWAGSYCLRDVRLNPDRKENKLEERTNGQPVMLPTEPDAELLAALEYKTQSDSYGWRDPEIDVQTMLQIGVCLKRSGDVLPKLVAAVGRFKPIENGQFDVYQLLLKRRSATGEMISGSSVLPDEYRVGRANLIHAILATGIPDVRPQLIPNVFDYYQFASLWHLASGSHLDGLVNEALDELAQIPARSFKDRNPNPYLQQSPYDFAGVVLFRATSKSVRSIVISWLIKNAPAELGVRLPAASRFFQAKFHDFEREISEAGSYTHPTWLELDHHAIKKYLPLMHSAFNGECYSSSLFKDWCFAIRDAVRDKSLDKAGHAAVRGLEMLLWHSGNFIDLFPAERVKTMVRQEKDFLIALRKDAKLAEEYDPLGDGIRARRDRCIVAVDTIASLSEKHSCWDAIRLLLFILHDLSVPSLPSDLRCACRNRNIEINPWSWVPDAIHRLIWIAKERGDAELKDVQYGLADYLRERFERRKSLLPVSLVKPGQHPEINEPDPVLREFYCESLADLNTDQGGRVHRSLRQVAEFDPDPSVKLAASDAARRASRAGRAERDPARIKSVLNAWHWIRWGTIYTFGEDRLDHNGAGRVKEQEVTESNPY